MFEIGFSEILIIMAIALVVLGPEKLPKLAATVGRWMGRAKAMARQFREQLEEEANKLDLTKELNKQMEAAKRQLDIAKSLGLDESLEPAKRTPAPEGVLAGEPAAEAASAESGASVERGSQIETGASSPSSQPLEATDASAGEPSAMPGPAEVSQPLPAASSAALPQPAPSIEIPVADAPAAPERVSEDSTRPPPSPSHVEASVDSVHERRH